MTTGFLYGFTYFIVVELAHTSDVIILVACFECDRHASHTILNSARKELRNSRVAAPLQRRDFFVVSFFGAVAYHHYYKRIGNLNICSCFGSRRSCGMTTRPMLPDGHKPDVTR